MKRFYSLPRLLIVATILLAFPLLLRAFAGQPLIPGALSYEELLTPASLLNPFGYFAFLGQWQLLLSLLLGLVSMLLVHLVVRKHIRTTRARLIIPTLFVMNPLFISLFTSISPLTIAVPLALLLLWRGGSLILALLLSYITPFFSLLYLPLFLFKGKRRFLLPFLLAIILLMLRGWPLHTFTLQVVEFGLPGVSLFFVTLAVIEGILLWSREQHRLLFSWWLLILFLAPWSRAAILLAGLGATLFVGLFIERLLKRKWLLEETRSIAILLILCSFLFLLVAQILLTVNAAPSTDLVRTLSAADGRLLIQPEDEQYVRYFSHAEPVLCDACPTYYAWRFEEAEKLLDQSDVQDILITEEMRQGGIWNRDEEGLLFLLQHSSRFHLVARYGAYELWGYNSQKALKESSELSEE